MNLAPVVLTGREESEFAVNETARHVKHLEEVTTVDLS